jgi:hypothetical protein
MRRVRSLSFEPLEERKLLSRAHVAVHSKPAVATTALVFNGTLRVDNNAATMSEDDEGDTTTSTPVSGQLGPLGQVRGIWNTSDDEYGDYLGPDTLQLRTAKGTFVVAFSEQNTDSASHLHGGATDTVDPQLGSVGTGAYAHERESGTIGLTSNSARNEIVSLTLTTTGT